MFFISERNVILGSKHLYLMYSTVWHIILVQLRLSQAVQPRAQTLDQELSAQEVDQKA